MPHPSRVRPRSRRLPCLEPLESRALPAVVWPGLTNPLAEVAGTDVLTEAQTLGPLPAVGQAGVVGTITRATPGSGDVDFYTFHLDRPTHVRLETLDRLGGSPLVSVLSLYTTDALSLRGYSLLTQDDGAARGGDAVVERTLGAGTYYVAVSGSGDRYFDPLMADSGYPGSTGAYGLRLTTSDAGLASDAGPTVLASDPAPLAALSASPLVLRLETSAPVDPATLVPDQTVWLTYNSTGDFGGPGDVDVPIGFVTFDSTPDGLQELQVTPAAPLAPGYYRLRLAGDPTANVAVVAGLDGTPLGAAPSQGVAGADFTLSFQVTGVEGNTAPGVGSDEVAAGAHELGDVTGVGLVQAAGAIGNDPNDPVPFDPNDVDFYHFRVSGAGRFAFASEVFAGRIGSGLNAALTLFRLDASTSKLVLVTANLDSGNTTTAADGWQSLLTDPVLYAGLTAGDYYLAVSSGFNAPDASTGFAPGTGGVFDPTQPYSGSNGDSTGPYVLNLKVEPVPTPPQVVATSLPVGGTLSTPPLTFTVRFSEPVNVQQLAAAAYTAAGASTVDAVTLVGPGGTVVQPRLLHYNPATDTATFLLMDPLPNGSYALHLSGALGLTDRAGDPLRGNDPSGDYVVPFAVAAGPRGPWLNQPGNDSPASAQAIDFMFPHELTAGVTVTRIASPVGATDTADYFSVTLPEDGNYQLSFANVQGLPRNLTVQVITGGVVTGSFDVSGGTILLTAGTHVLGVTWGGGGPSGVGYQLGLRLLGTGETATTLTDGPAPVLGFRLVGVPSNPVPPPGPPSPQPPVPNPSPGPPPQPPPIVPPTPNLPGSPPGFPAGVLTALGEAPLGTTGAGTGLASAAGAGTELVAAPPAIRLAGATLLLDGGSEEGDAVQAGIPPAIGQVIRPDGGRVRDVLALLAPGPGLFRSAAALASVVPDPAALADAFFTLFGASAAGPGRATGALAAAGLPTAFAAAAVEASAPDAAFVHWPRVVAWGWVAGLMGGGAALGLLRARRRAVVHPELSRPVR